MPDENCMVCSVTGVCMSSQAHAGAHFECTACAPCRGRLKLVVTDVRNFQLAYIDDFATKAELIDANMASAHIPFFLDWRPFATYR